MGAMKELRLYCQENRLDPNNLSMALRHMKRGTFEGEMVDLGSPERDITFADLVTLTGNVLGTSVVGCPYCGADKPLSRRLQVTLRSNSGSYHCFYCDARGSVVGDGEMDPEKDAEAARKQAEFEAGEKAERQAAALKIWDEAVPITGTPAERYLRQRAITSLPPNVGEVLRFHPRCPMGARRKVACMVALFRDPATDVPTGIHRTAIPDRWHPGQEVERMALGRMGAIKLWRSNGATLVVGEGIETVLSAAQLSTQHGLTLKSGDPLLPAWALGVANGIKYLPVLDGVEKLTILVDSDASGTGRRAMNTCRARWVTQRRDVIPLTLTNPALGDFNDLLRAHAK